MSNISFRSRIGEIIQRYRYFRNKKLRKSVPILSSKDSISKIIKNDLSLSRFGDGELLMVFQYMGLTKSNSTFQDYDVDLGRRLFEILNEPDDRKVIIGLPHCMFGRGVSDMTFGARYFWERFSADWASIVVHKILRGGEFADTNLTRFYNDYKNSKTKQQNVQKSVDDIKMLWANRNIMIVEGEKTRMGVGNDLFDNVVSIRRILVPSTNAYSRYKEILNAIKAHHKNHELVILAVGMTATVLAYDLAGNEIQALDLGHIDIEYEWYRRNSNTREKIPGKFTNEASDRESVADCNDKTYFAQIIDKINIE